MTREEAARVLKYLWIERDENAKLMQQLTTRFFERQEALRMGAAALREQMKRSEGCGWCADDNPRFCKHKGWDICPMCGRELSGNAEQVKEVEG